MAAMERSSNQAEKSGQKGKMRDFAAIYSNRNTKCSTALHFRTLTEAEKHWKDATPGCKDGALQHGRG